MKRFHFHLICAGLCLCAFLAGAWILADQLIFQPAQSDAANAEAQSLYGEPQGDSAAGSSGRTDKVSQNNKTRELPPLAALQKINPEVRGWISIPGTVVDYPVVSPPKNSPGFYLSHNWERKPSPYGSIFFGAGSGSADAKNRVLYGHSMKDGRMFAPLLSYGSLDFYRSHPDVLFREGDRESDWKIFAVIKVNTDPSQGKPFDYLKTSFPSSGAFLDYVREVRIRSVLNLPVDVKPTDQILTLSTCSYEFDGFRTAVLARRVRKGRDPP